MFVALVLLVAPGCFDPGRELAKKFPVNPAIEDARRDLLAILDDSAQKAAMDEDHGSWLKGRSTHCATLAKLGGSGKSSESAGENMLETCFAGFDKQRLDALAQIRLAALARQPALGAAPASGTNISIAFEITNQADSLAVSPDGRIAAVGSLAAGVDLYDVVSVQKLRTLQAEKAAAHLSFSHNGRLLATASRQVRGTKIWDVYSGRLLRDYKGSMGPIAMLPDGRHLLHADGEKLIVYDYIADKAQPVMFAHGESIYRLILSPDAKRVATLTLGGTITLWDWVQTPDAKGLTLSKTAEAKTSQDRSRASGIQITASGDVLYSVSHDGVLIKWSLPALERQEVLGVGRIVEGAILGLPGDPRLVLAGQKEGRGNYLLFIDPRADTAAVVDIDRGGRAFLAGVPGGPRMFVATYRDLRHVEIPQAASFQSLDTVAASLAVSPAGTAPAASIRVPMLRGLAQDAAVEAIGVYEGSRESGAAVGRGAGRASEISPVVVSIGRTNKPVVLVLSSYEPVAWRIEKLPGTALRHVLLSGYHQSTVQGVSGTEITRIGSAYAYSFGSAQYSSLQQAVTQYIGKGIDRFQGSYAGTRFSIGSDAPQAGTSGAGGVGTRGSYKCADAGGNMVYADRECAELGLRPIGQLAAPPGPVALPAPVPVPRAGSSSSRATARVPAPTRVIRCGGDTIVCDSSDTVICGGRVVSCK